MIKNSQCSSVMVLLLAFTAVIAAKAHEHFKIPSLFIVGGEVAEAGQFPHQVLLFWRDGDYYNPFCGGTLICKNWVLTAGHCVGRNVRDLYIGYGSNIISGMTGIKVSAAYRHENYNRYTLQNDLTLLKLHQPIQCSYAANTIDLEENEQCGLVSGQPKPSVIVSGHGTTSENNQYMTTKLMYVVLTMNTKGECKNVYGNELLDGMECASDPGEDSCQGDSGGPLMTTTNSFTGDTVCGIVSWGYGCARPGYPGVYADVAYYKDWIENNMNSRGGCDKCNDIDN